MKHVMVDIAIAHFFARLVVFIALAVGLVIVGYETTSYALPPYDVASMALTFSFAFPILLVLPRYWYTMPDISCRDLVDLKKRIMRAFRGSQPSHSTDPSDQTQLENVTDRPFGLRWWKQIRASMIERDFVQDWNNAVPVKYKWTYGVLALLDTFCLIFWILAVFHPDGIEWNTSKGLAIRLQLAGETESTMNSGLKAWLRYQLPHQIISGFSCFVFTMTFLGSWTLVIWPHAWRKTEKSRRTKKQQRKGRQAVLGPSKPETPFDILSSRASQEES